MPSLPVSPGAPPGEGHSARWLRVPGISDALRGATGGRGRSIAISLKERSAILVTGQRADLVLWYDPSQLAMTTSRAYANRLPDWLASFTRSQPIASRLGEVWSPRDPALLERLSGGGDDGVGEGPGEGGLGRSFPHVPIRASEPAEAFVTTPAATDLLFAAAEAAIVGEALGRDRVADLLAISVSSHDYAGHAWGQESWERRDILFALDRRLGGFLEFLDRAVGRDRYAVVLTSDHGAVPLVERSRAAGADAHRVSKDGLLGVAERAADEALGPGDWVLDYLGNGIYLSEAFGQRLVADRRAATAAIATAVRRIPGMGLVAPAERLAGGCSRRTGEQRLACEVIALPQFGEVYAVPAAGSVIGDDVAGTGHGWSSRSERVVPIVVFEPGHTPREERRPVSMLRIAPTLARLLGIPPPSAAELPTL